jgi:hypothetical protein
VRPTGVEARLDRSLGDLYYYNNEKPLFASSEVPKIRQKGSYYFS